MLERAKQLLRKHEGFRRFVYFDSVGIPTVGIGRNLKDRGITEAEAFFLLENDVQVVVEELRIALPFFDALDETRQVVLVDMAVNMGVPKLLGFSKALTAMREARWTAAAAEMLDSQWSRQVGNRAIELAEMMRTG